MITVHASNDVASWCCIPPPEIWTFPLQYMTATCTVGIKRRAVEGVHITIPEKNPAFFEYKQQTPFSLKTRHPILGAVCFGSEPNKTWCVCVLSALFAKGSVWIVIKVHPHNLTIPVYDALMGWETSLRSLCLHTIHTLVGELCRLSHALKSTTSQLILRIHSPSQRHMIHHIEWNQRRHV